MKEVFDKILFQIDLEIDEIDLYLFQDTETGNTWSFIILLQDLSDRNAMSQWK